MPSNPWRKADRRGRRGAGTARWAVLLALLAPAWLARAEEESAIGAVQDRAVMREQILDGQRTQARNQARQRALFAYRAARARQLRFATSPKDRLPLSQTLDRALLALQVSDEEARALAREFDAAQADHVRLERAFLAKVLPGKKKANEPKLRFARPVRGTPVSVPGLRQDNGSPVENLHMDVEWLARLNEPVKAVAEGVVKRVEALPQGGFVVVTAHPGGYTSILAGLRDTLVQTGDPVSVGQPLGLTGRNLDGAAVVSLEIWRHREALNAAKLLSIRL
jgi:murein DD-endopeptidase MepM/ murein hydrolase activator NlpD